MGSQNKGGGRQQQPGQSDRQSRQQQQGGRSRQQEQQGKRSGQMGETDRDRDNRNDNR